MVPYGRLSEQAKDLDRGSVVAVLDALTAAGYVTVETPVAELDIDGDWAVETGSDPVWGSLDDDGEPVIETEDALWPAAEAVELALAILAVNSRLTCESEQDGAADA
jgi:hypothetical protein